MDDLSIMLAEQNVSDYLVTVRTTLESLGYEPDQIDNMLTILEVTKKAFVTQLEVAALIRAMLDRNGVGED